MIYYICAQLNIIMSEQPQQQPSYQDDEIDLRKLFQAIGNFFVNIGHGFINIILTIRRATSNYKILLIAAMIVGLITGLAYNKFTKPFNSELKAKMFSFTNVNNGLIPNLSLKICSLSNSES